MYFLLVKNFFEQNGGVLEPPEPPSGYATEQETPIGPDQNDRTATPDRDNRLIGTSDYSDHAQHIQ
jgi:hypothetical protein